MSIQPKLNECKDYNPRYNEYINEKCPWINKFLFQEIIRRDKLNENIIVKDYSIELAVPKGNNCAGEVMRAKVYYSSNDLDLKEQINFVIKVQKSDVVESFKQNELFTREIAVFRDVIPRVEQLLRDINDETKISPRYIILIFTIGFDYLSLKINFLRCYRTDTEKSYLILEDLSVSGYKNVDKKIGLTVDCYKSLYSTLAKWHAATSILFHSVSIYNLKNFKDLFN